MWDDDVDVDVEQRTGDERQETGDIGSWPHHIQLKSTCLLATMPLTSLLLLLLLLLLRVVSRYQRILVVQHGNGIVVLPLPPPNSPT